MSPPDSGEPAPADGAQLATLVVAEDGARYVLPFGHVWGLALLQQAGDEPLPALASRVARVVTRVQRNRQRVSTAWLLLNRRGNEVAIATRLAIARTLATALADAGGGLLVLIAEIGDAAEGRAAVFALVNRLLEIETRAPVTVRVRFSRSAVGS